MRLPDGRIILINLLEIPEAYLATLCSDNQRRNNLEMSAGRSTTQETQE
jgi:hypothetical protein